MQLSAHFSDTELGVAGADRRVVDNARYLCHYILEPIRQHFGRPVNVHNGYRTAQYNTLVGGAIGSFHLYAGGQAAADIDVGGDTLPTYRQVFDWIRLQSHLPFDKVVLEQNSVGEDSGVHIQIDRSNEPRREAFVGRGKNQTLVQTK
jgi:hypothetical protein